MEWDKTHLMTCLTDVKGAKMQVNIHFLINIIVNNKLEFGWYLPW